jgi:uncharacterized membrane protein YqjE
MHFIQLCQLWVDAIQTTGIVIIAAALVYVIWRLERQIKTWVKLLEHVDGKLGDDKETREELARLDARVSMLESRLS